MAMSRSFALGASPHLLFGAVVLGLMAFEYWLGRLAGHRTHDWRESTASLGVALGRSLIRGIEAALAAGPAVFLYDHRLFHFDPMSAPALIFLILGFEFAYYWYHRATHRIRWMWATHAVHHSATQMNLTAAIRLGWTGVLSGSFLFFLPLVWLGFSPAALAALFAVNLAYQFFLHTELVPALGPLEWVLNTPQHHRVHHASNAACLDHNYGGILIVFDRLFGTLAAAPADEALRYGVVGGTPSFNPLRIAFAEWWSLLRDFWGAEGWRQRLRILFGPPGATEPAP
jgi:sterol desaturase/sphingolipid hydroxylase (fatty acid hydroxylase superfamily)